MLWLGERGRDAKKVCYPIQQPPVFCCCCGQRALLEFESTTSKKDYLYEVSSSSAQWKTVKKVQLTSKCRFSSVAVETQPGDFGELFVRGEVVES